MTTQDVSNPDSTCFMLDNGALKPLATALNIGSAIKAAAASNSSANSVSSAGSKQMSPVGVDITLNQNSNTNTNNNNNIQESTFLLEKNAKGSNTIETANYLPKRREGNQR